MQLTPHRRQFVIGRRRYEPGEGWTHRELPDGFMLSSQGELRVSSGEDGGLVLGAAHPGASTGGRAGRYVTLGWPYLEPDASALLSIYFASGPDGPLVSSSPALMAGLLPAGEPVGHRPRWGGLNWIPGPGSPVAGVRKLLPGQRLRVTDLAVDEPDDLAPAVGGAQAASVLAEELTATIGQAAAGAGTTYLALTAGLDSRTLLGAALAAGVRFELVTQVVGDQADVRVAADIARHLGVRHHVVEPGPPVEADARAWREHTGGSYDDIDGRRLVPRGQYRFLEQGSVLVRGGCFEVGRRFLASTLGDLTLRDATGAAIWRRFEGATAPDPVSVGFLDDWLAARRDRRDGLDLVDGFYDDQRLGGWLAAVEHGLDLLPGVTVVPANSARAKAALLAPPPQERAAGTLQHQVVRDLAPALAGFPVNPRPTGPARYVRTARVQMGRALRPLRRR